MHHERSEQPRDMRLRSLSLELDVGHAAIAALLGAQHGAGRVFATEHA